jgi:signal peptidase I
MRAVQALVALIVAVAVLVVGARIAGFGTLAEKSSSMAPAIRPGDLLVVRSVAARSVAAGDVVSFHDPGRGGRLITHRVTTVQRTGDVIEFRTRGDANPDGERWSSPAGQDLGRTVATIPLAGAAIGVLGDPFVVACLAGIILTLLAVAAVDRRRRAAVPVRWRTPR